MKMKNTNNTSSVRDEIFKQLTTDQANVRELFIRSFPDAAGIFSNAISEALSVWEVWKSIPNASDRDVFCQNTFLAVFSLQISSMQLLLSGHLAAAGNVQRQVLESISLTYLCANSSLSVYEDYISDRYSVQKACRDLQRHGESMSVRSEAIEFLDKLNKHYNNYSHYSHLTRLTQLRGDKKAIYMGASFDGDNLNIYETEVKWRVGLAEKFGNIQVGIKNVLKSSVK